MPVIDVSILSKPFKHINSSGLKRSSIVLNRLGHVCVHTNTLYLQANENKDKEVQEETLATEAYTWDLHIGPPLYLKSMESHLRSHKGPLLGPVSS